MKPRWKLQTHTPAAAQARSIPVNPGGPGSGSGGGWWWSPSPDEQEDEGEGTQGKPQEGTDPLSPTPQTGDDSNITLWKLMLVSALLGMIYMLVWAYMGSRGIVIWRGRGEKRRKENSRHRLKRTICVVACAVCAASAAVAVVNILQIEKDYEAARDEYEALRLEYAPKLTVSAMAGGETLDSEGPGADMSHLSALNPDFIGWLTIEGVGISYPVVQGEDNEKYLTSTFMGERSASGAIFMGYNYKQGFESPLAVIHGHNMKDGSMFAELERFLDEDLPDENRRITVTTKHGETLEYTVFAARVTDIADNAYHIDAKSINELKGAAISWGAPEQAKRILTLSTCANSGGKNARILIQAAQE